MKTTVTPSIRPATTAAIRLLTAALAMTFAPLVLAVSTPPTDSHWRLANIASLTSIDPSLTDLMVDAEGNISGMAGCNQYHRSLGDDGYSPIAVTRKACPDEIMTQEQAFLAALELTTSWRVDNDRLLLQGAGGQTLAVMLEPIIPTYHFDCQGEPVVFDVIRRGQIRLTHQGQTVMMERTQTASDTRYVDESGDVVFWGKGPQGWFTRDGETRECQQVPPPAQD